MFSKHTDRVIIYTQGMSHTHIHTHTHTHTHTDTHTHTHSHTHCRTSAVRDRRVSLRSPWSWLITNKVSFNQYTHAYIPKDDIMI